MGAFKLAVLSEFIGDLSSFQRGEVNSELYMRQKKAKVASREMALKWGRLKLNGARTWDSMLNEVRNCRSKLVLELVAARIARS